MRGRRAELRIPIQGDAMPIYEYVCKECRKGFEVLVRGSAVPECPACHSTRLDKQLSVFSASVQTPFGAAKSVPELSACGTCGDPRGPGACSLD
jgi:putative FmdB family regulatory protein